MKHATVWDMQGWDCPVTLGGYLDGVHLGEGHFDLCSVSHTVYHDEEGKVWVAAGTKLTPHRTCHPDWDVTASGVHGGIRLAIPKAAMGEIRATAENYHGHALISVAEVYVKQK